MTFIFFMMILDKISQNLKDVFNAFLTKTFLFYKGEI